LIAVAACLAATYAFASGSSSLRAKLSHPDFSAFNEWQITHAKIYQDETEMMMRFGIWLAKHHEIQQHNAKLLNYTLGHNQFSDMTATEFKQQVLCMYTDVEGVDFTDDGPLADGPLADVDWTTKGVLADIKN
jgi:xylem cysteine proteinase